MNEGVVADAPETKSRNASGLRFARIISWVGHPLVFVSVTLALVVSLRLANRVGLLVLLALILAVVLPTAILLFRGARSGRWSDADVSVQTERKQFYPRAILISAGGVFSLFVLQAPRFVLQGATVTLALLLIASWINRFLKISLHTMFAFFCAVILVRITWIGGTIALTLAMLVFWSRLRLRRHLLADVIWGMLLGTAGAVVVAWWP
jgi:membrane-associated phospholipid phosphatase